MKKEYSKVTSIDSLSEQDIKKILRTSIALTEDRKHVICLYVLADKECPTEAADEVLVMVSEEAAQPIAVLKTGELVPLSSKLCADDIKCVGYKQPGPTVSDGVVIAPAGTIHAPDSFIYDTFWTEKRV